MTIHPYLFPSLFVAAVSTAAAAILRRAVRREYASLLPWLKIWGILCAIPALLYLILCLPGFEETADRLIGSATGTGMELLAGAAGVLPGLMWDETAERLEQRRARPFGLSATLLRSLPIAALMLAILIPYGFLFNRCQPEQGQTPASAPDAALVSETTVSEAEISAPAAKTHSSAAETASPAENTPDPARFPTDVPGN